MCERWLCLEMLPPKCGKDSKKYKLQAQGLSKKYHIQCSLAEIVLLFTTSCDLWLDCASYECNIHERSIVGLTWRFKSEIKLLFCEFDDS